MRVRIRRFERLTARHAGRAWTSGSLGAVEASTLRSALGASPLLSNGSSAEADICDIASPNRWTSALPLVQSFTASRRLLRPRL